MSLKMMCNRIWSNISTFSNLDTDSESSTDLPMSIDQELLETTDLMSETVPYEYALPLGHTLETLHEYALIQVFSNLSMMDLINLDKASPRFRDIIQRHFYPKIKVLDFRSTKSINDKKFAEMRDIIEHVGPYIKEFYGPYQSPLFRYFRYRLVRAIGKNCKQLEILELHDIALGKKEFYGLAPIIANLKELRLYGNEKIGFRYLLKVMKKGRTNLDSIVLPNMAYKRQFLISDDDSITSIRNVVISHIDDWYSLADYIDNVDDIHALTLDHSEAKIDADVMRFIRQLKIRHLEHFNRLGCTWSKNDNAKVLLKLAINDLPDLRHVDFTGTRSWTPNCTFRLLQFPYIESLALNCMPRLGQRDLVAISLLPKIKNLRIALNQQFSYQTILQLIQQLNTLEYIDVTGCNFPPEFFLDLNRYLLNNKERKNMTVNVGYKCHCGKLTTPQPPIVYTERLRITCENNNVDETLMYMHCIGIKEIGNHNIRSMHNRVVYNLPLINRDTWLSRTRYTRFHMLF